MESYNSKNTLFKLRTMLRSMLKDMISHGDWENAEKLIEVCNDPELRMLLDTNRHVNQTNLATHEMISPPYPSPSPYFDKPSLLKGAVERGEWDRVGRFLKQGVSDELHAFAFTEACKRASCQNLKKLIIPYCNRDQIAHALLSFLSEGQNERVDKVLECDKDSHWELGHDKLTLILILCVITPSDLVNMGQRFYRTCQGIAIDMSRLTKIIKQGNWVCVETCLGLPGISDEQRLIAFQEIRKHANKRNQCTQDGCSFSSPYHKSHHWAQAQISTVSPYCDINCLLMGAVERGEWDSVGRYLRQCVSDELHAFAFTEACKRASCQNLKKLIIPYCKRDQIAHALLSFLSEGQNERVNTVLACVEDNHWKLGIDKLSLLTLVVNKNVTGFETLLRRCFCDSKLVWKDLISEPVAKHIRGVNNVRIFRRCADGTLKELPTQSPVKWMQGIASLDKTITKLKNVFTIATDTNDQTHFVTCIITCCAGSLLKYGLSEMFKHAQSARNTAKEQNRGFAESGCKWTLFTVTKVTSNEICFNEFHFATETPNIDMIVKSFLEDLWWAAEKILQQKVDIISGGRIISMVIEKADDSVFLEHILPNCTNEQLHNNMLGDEDRNFSKLLRLVGDRKKTWKCDEILLDRELLEEVCKHRWDDVLMRIHQCMRWPHFLWVVQKALHYEETDDFIRRTTASCCDEAVCLILEHFIFCDKWKEVHRLVNIGVSTTNRRYVIQEGLKRAGNIDEERETTRTTSISDKDWDKDEYSDDVYDPALKNAKNTISEYDLKYNVLPLYLYNEVEVVMKVLKAADLWEPAIALLFQFVSDTMLKWVNGKRDDKAFWEMLRKPCHTNSHLQNLCKTASKQFGKDATKICSRLSKPAKDVSPLLYDVLHESVVDILLEKWLDERRPNTVERKSSAELSKKQVLKLCQRTTKKKKKKICKTGRENAFNAAIENIEDFFKKHDSSTTKTKEPTFASLSSSIHDLHTEYCQTTKFDDRTNLFFSLWFIQFLLLELNKNSISENALLLILTTVPVVPGIQSVALRVLLRKGKWKFIEHARLSHVWENVRRQLFQAAVTGKRWSIVKRWADHTLYDDQRLWAMERAFEEKEWEVYLLLADHGLTDIQRFGVHFRLAKEAQLSVVHQMLERGAVVNELEYYLQMEKRNNTEKCKRLGSELQQLIEDINNPSKEGTERKFRILMAELEGMENKIDTKIDLLWEKFRSLPKIKTADEELKFLVTEIESIRNDIKPDLELQRRASQMKGLRKKLTDTINSSTTMEEVNQSGNWLTLLYMFHKTELTAKQNRYVLLTKARKQQKWQVVIHLIRRGVKDTVRNKLFRSMIKERQWEVCRVLLEKGVSHDTFLPAIPTMVQFNQWILLSRVMEYEVDVDVRKQIMQWAIEKQEGSVIWQCYDSLRANMSIKKREQLFQNAVGREMWQAIKPLVRERDSVGIKHRDIALLEAIDHHQWDVVDYCQLNHADINIKDYKGNTPMHRAARKKEWDDVIQLTERDGDPSLLDSDGWSVLHLAIRAEEWDVVELLIKYHGDIHKPTNELLFFHTKQRTPLQMLIDRSQGSVIESSLMWSPDQGNKVTGTTKEGKNSLHAACLSGSLPKDTLYYLMARGVDPLAVTLRGHSVLAFAVMNNTCPQKMVAECIQLGISTHQPSIPDTSKGECKWWLSPIALSVMRGLPEVTQMLYESGSVSYRDLFRLRPLMHRLENFFIEEARDLINRFKKEIPYISYLEELTSPFEDIFEWGVFGIRRIYVYDYPFKRPKIGLIKKSAEYVLKASNTPRSLMSTCRNVLSHQAPVNKHRKQILLKRLKRHDLLNCVTFCDVTDLSKVERRKSIFFVHDNEEVPIEDEETDSEDDEEEDEEHDHYMNYSIQISKLFRRIPYIITRDVQSELTKRIYDIVENKPVFYDEFSFTFFGGSIPAVVFADGWDDIMGRNAERQLPPSWAD